MIGMYRKRQEKLISSLPDNSVLIIPGACLRLRSQDTHFPFRQDSNFYYLSGFNEPDSTLMIRKDKNKIESIIFVPKKDKVKEIWDGYRAGPEGAKKDYGFDKAFDNDQINTILPEFLLNKNKVYYPFGNNDGFDKKVVDWTHAANNQDRHSGKIDIADANSILGSNRLIKAFAEIEVIRQACSISASAHSAAMQFVKPGLNESDVEAYYMYEFAKRGGRYAAYNPIVAGGVNACVLHYNDNNCMLNDGDLILVDAGCEFNMYASDITRTYPINGKFSKEQLAVYEIVLAAQQASIEAVRPGNSVIEPQKVSEKIITQGLIDIGILDGEISELIEIGAFREYYMHKVGHWMGMDVHDVGPYMQNDNYLEFSEGMITTIEPGIYINNKSNADAKWHGIGIRIEDDILVTKNANENLTSAVPTDPNEIESLMNSS